MGGESLSFMSVFSEKEMPRGGHCVQRPFVAVSLLEHSDYEG